MSNAVIIENSAGNLIIRFNRPETRSPLSVSVLENLHAILDEAEQNQNIETIVFTGAGDVFASGADLREIALVTKETAREFALRGQSLMTKIAGSEKLTIAAINGFCFGGALDLALSCKKRIAGASAQFSHPGANLGIITGWGGTQRLPRLVGEAKALEIFLTATRVSAPEALQIGLIDKIAENPLEFALRLSSE
ncbi:MAG: enoyl-CoA hydratase/isomerase family protein [Pyrinomonadaceae bacterium]